MPSSHVGSGLHSSGILIDHTHSDSGGASEHVSMPWITTDSAPSPAPAPPSPAAAPSASHSGTTTSQTHSFPSFPWPEQLLSAATLGRQLKLAFSSPLPSLRRNRNVEPLAPVWHIDAPVPSSLCEVLSVKSSLDGVHPSSSFSHQ
eukprot:1086842-Rhodomonas_salina.1